MPTVTVHAPWHMARNTLTHVAWLSHESTSCLLIHQRQIHSVQQNWSDGYIWQSKYHHNNPWWYAPYPSWIWYNSPMDQSKIWLWRYPANANNVTRHDSNWTSTHANHCQWWHRQSASRERCIVYSSPEWKYSTWNGQHPANHEIYVILPHQINGNPPRSQNGQTTQHTQCKTTFGQQIQHPQALSTNNPQHNYWTRSRSYSSDS